MKKTTVNQNGRKVTRAVRHESQGWGATVWAGSGVVTGTRRYYYQTRAQAQQADIADRIGGQSGRIA